MTCRQQIDAGAKAPGTHRMSPRDLETGITGLVAELKALRLKWGPLMHPSHAAFVTELARQHRDEGWRSLDVGQLVRAHFLRERYHRGETT